MYLCLTLLYLTLFEWHFISFCEVSEASVCVWCVCVCMPVPVLFSFYLPLLVLTFHVQWESDYEITIINVLSVISIIKILVKLLQMTWGYTTGFVVCQSVCLSVNVFERHAFHIIMALLPTPNFSRTWSFSRQEELLKRGGLNLN